MGPACINDGTIKLHKIVFDVSLIFCAFLKSGLEIKVFYGTKILLFRNEHRRAHIS